MLEILKEGITSHANKVFFTEGKTLLLGIKNENFIDRKVPFPFFYRRQNDVSKFFNGLSRSNCVVSLLHVSLCIYCISFDINSDTIPKLS